MTRDEILRAIFHLQHHTSDGVARNSDLASRLGVKGPSVTTRIQKLASEGLVNYVWGKGVSLTEDGERLATASVTRIQTIERLLREVLHLPPDFVTEETAQIDRYVGDRIMDGMLEYFGDRVNPSSAP